MVITMDIRVEEQLNEESINIYHKKFNDINKSNWTIEQFKQSLRNQEYLKHLVFYKENEIVGISEYTLDNPWNKISYDIIYFKDTKTKVYITTYTKNKIRK